MGTPQTLVSPLLKTTATQNLSIIPLLQPPFRLTFLKKICGHVVVLHLQLGRLIPVVSPNLERGVSAQRCYTLEELVQRRCLQGVVDGRCDNTADLVPGGGVTFSVPQFALLGNRLSISPKSRDIYWDLAYFELTS